MKPLLIKHLSGEPIGRFPVWMMRQAGRFLESYQAIRAQHSFWEMVSQPKIAAEVSLLPVNELGTDAVIFFSDILTLPFGMDIPIAMKESVGPVVETPLRSFQAFEQFLNFDPKKHVGFVGEAMGIIREKLDPNVALIGFAGAPWTVASYLVEGQGKTGFGKIKNWLHEDRATLQAALSLYTEATIKYLRYQCQSGAQVVQVFDTWASEMPKEFFSNYYVNELNRIFDTIRREEKVPVIYFSKRSHHLKSEFSRLRPDVFSVDELVSLPEVEKQIGTEFSYQGNFDPMLLFSSEGVIRRETRKLVQQARTLSKPAIINLGHGVLPKTPVQNVKAFLSEAKTLWT